MANSRLVIFDCDGTIVDSQHAIVAAAVAAFEACGFQAPARSEILSIVGLSLHEAIKRLAPGADERQRGVLVENYKYAFQLSRVSRAVADPLYPHAREVISALGAGAQLALGVATGKSRRGVDHLLEREGLVAYFATIQTADTHPSKPHPSMIAEAMAEVGAAPENTIMVGDTTFDMEMAALAGVGAIGVNWGYHDAGLLMGAGAHAIVGCWRDIPGAIDLIFRERTAA